MFCRCSNEGENAPPNTTICPVCMGHPGTLPVANETAIQWSAKTALALNCTISEQSKFDRKNYFYPDLPKGYQISQYDQPIGKGGFVDIQIPDAPDGARTQARIQINRLHLEEDAAKLMHAPDHNASLVDFNRSSTPLMEIVSEPDLRSPQEAKIYLQELRNLVRYLDVSHADMEKGHLRCDANVSIRFEHNGVPVWSPISEIKNLNSFRAVERALEYEGARLYREWINDGEVTNRKHKITVGWDDAKSVTTLQRSKEEAHDYRYFPDPDLPPLLFTQSDIDALRAEIPELPQAKRVRFMTEYSLAESDARILIDDKTLAKFFEESASELAAWLLAKGAGEDTAGKSYKLLSGILINKLFPLLEKHGQTIANTRVTPENTAQLTTYLVQNTINSTTAQTVLDQMVETGADPAHIIEEQGLAQVTDTSAISLAADSIISQNPDAVANYKAGKLNVIMFLVGQVMREMKGKADPAVVKDELEKKIGTVEFK